MRQTALIVLLAISAAYVPPRPSNFRCCGPHLYRIRSSDDLAGGRSTFMVEEDE